MRTFFFLTALIAGSGVINAQTATTTAGDYKPMTYSSRSATTKKDAYIKRLSPKYLSTDKKYIAEWNNYLYNIYQSYGEASKNKQFIVEPYVMNYLQSVMQRILDSNRIRQKIEVVPTRYQEPNAYVLGDNRLYVNIGVLGLLENEAQLAFLLCHEISHQLLNHAQEQFAARRAMVADKAVKKEIRDIRAAKYNKLDRAVQFALKYRYTFANYSRAKERAADSMAVELLRKTRYDIGEGEEMLELLAKSDSDRTQIDYARFLASTSSQLRPEWTQGNKYNIRFGGKRAIEYEEDSVRTHPDIPARKAFVRKAAEAGAGGEEKFIVSRTAFDSLKGASSYEIIESYASNKRYAATAYHALAQLQRKPDNPYLIRKAAFALRDVVNAVRTHTIQNHVPIETEEGAVAYNQLLRIIDRTTLAELTQLYYNFLDRYSAQLAAYPELRNVTNPNDKSKKS